MLTAISDLAIKRSKMLGSSAHLNDINDLFQGPNGSTNRQQNHGQIVLTTSNVNFSKVAVMKTIQQNVKEFVESANPE